MKSYSCATAMEVHMYMFTVTFICKYRLIQLLYESIWHYLKYTATASCTWQD